MSNTEAGSKSQSSLKEAVEEKINIFCCDDQGEIIATVYGVAYAPVGISKLFKRSKHGFNKALLDRIKSLASSYIYTDCDLNSHDPINPGGV